MDNNDVGGNFRQPDRFLLLKRLSTQIASAGKWFNDWVIPALRSFANTLPHLAIWLAIPVSLLCLGLAFQGGASRGTSSDSILRIQRIEFTSEPEGSLVLFLSYPHKLFVNPAGTSEQSISVWLQYSNHTTGASSTPTATPRPPKRSAITPTPFTLTSLLTPPTETPLPPHVVSFIATANDVVFVDNNGVAVPNRVILTPSDGQLTPAVMHLRPQPGQKNTTTIDVSINNMLPAGEPAIQMDLENPTRSFLRQLGSLICGTPLFISALITALIAFAVQNWSKRNEEWQRQFEEMREIQGELNALASLLKRDPPDGARYYLELLGRPDPKWQEPETKRRLEYEFQQRIESRELRIVTQLWSVASDHNKLESMLQVLSISHDELSNLLKQASKSKELDKDWQTKARVLAEKLLPQ
jgi:hypothetical protein